MRLGIAGVFPTGSDPRDVMPPSLADLLRAHPISVTGIGAFSAAGVGASALAEAAVAARSTAEEREFVIGAKTGRFPVCPAPAIDITRPELRPVRRMDRCVQMAWLAAHEAWTQAGLVGAYPSERIGVMVGSSRGPLGKRNEQLDQAGARPPAPSLAADTTFASVSGALAQGFKAKGPGAMIAATCASGAFAIALAAEQIVLGNADVMLVGGTEAPLQPGLLAQMQAAGVLASHAEAERASRPFDTGRNGLVLGEGSGFLVLESARTAAARRARPLARLAGWALGIDDSGRAGVNPQGSGLAHVIPRALRLAGLQPDQIDYINAHGTGTRLNDAAESRAVVGLLGRAVPCTSTKPITGHCLGATPALEAIICIETLRRQVIPPTANCDAQDPLCEINALPLQARTAKVAATMSNSLGFWGYHASLIFCPA